MAQVFENIGAGEGNRILDTQLGKLAHVVELVHVFVQTSSIRWPYVSIG
jgi:hypothetical protein